jgi:tetratricopeptide (TPR) repeat protein
MVLPDTGIAIGCFSSIDSTVRGSQVLRRDARGPAACQVAPVLGDGWSERLARPSQTHLDSPADAREACSLALKASAFLRPGGYESVPELIRAFLELRPDSVFGHRVLAYASEKLGHTDAARESYERALELDPNSFSVQLLYAQFLADNGEPQTAWQVLEPLAGSGRSNDLVTIALVNILSEQRRLDRCLQILENAVKVSPRNSYLWQQMAACRLQLRGPQAAIGPLTRVVELLPETGSFRGTLARLLETTGILDEAEKQYRELLEVEPENPVVYYWLARFLREHRPRARREALTMAEKALRLPLHPSLPREKIEELIGEICGDVVGRMETEPSEI